MGIDPVLGEGQKVGGDQDQRAGGDSWEAADDRAALGASAVIAFNGVLLLRPALNDLIMDRTADGVIVALVRRAAEQVSEVLAIEKLAVRKAGLGYQAVIHVQTAPQTPLHEAHALGGRVKGAIRAAVLQMQFVLVHMEPFENPDQC